MSKELNGPEEESKMVIVKSNAALADIGSLKRKWERHEIC